MDIYRLPGVCAENPGVGSTDTPSGSTQATSTSGSTQATSTVGRLLAVMGRLFRGSRS
jgi:hypothetical protein